MVLFVGYIGEKLCKKNERRMMGIENNIEEKNLENRAININSIQANSLYYVKNYR